MARAPFRSLQLRPVAGMRLIEAAFGFAAACALLGAVSPVRAQSTGQQATESQTITISGTTARKRNELAQDVPITMDVIGGQDLRDAGITVCESPAEIGEKVQAFLKL